MGGAGLGITEILVRGGEQSPQGSLPSAEAGRGASSHRCYSGAAHDFDWTWGRGMHRGSEKKRFHEGIDIWVGSSRMDKMSPGQRAFQTKHVYAAQARLKCSLSLSMLHMCQVNPRALKPLETNLTLRPSFPILEHQ